MIWMLHIWCARTEKDNFPQTIKETVNFISNPVWKKCFLILANSSYGALARSLGYDVFDWGVCVDFFSL